jgi:hypothetical protein
MPALAGEKSSAQPRRFDTKTTGPPLPLTTRTVRPGARRTTRKAHRASAAVWPPPGPPTESNAPGYVQVGLSGATRSVAYTKEDAPAPRNLRADRGISKCRCLSRRRIATTTAGTRAAPYRRCRVISPPRWGQRRRAPGFARACARNRGPHSSPGSRRSSVSLSRGSPRCSTSSDLGCTVCP